MQWENEIVVWCNDTYDCMFDTVIVQSIMFTRKQICHALLDLYLLFSMNNVIQMNENADSLLKDPACQKSREHFLSAMRVLELVQIGEIEMLLDTITGVC